MGNVRIEPINDDNFYAVSKLRVSKEQKGFLAENVYSMAHAYLSLAKGQPVFPFGIFLGDKPIGFLMVGFDIFADRELDPKVEWFLRRSYVLWRLMIDKRYQKKGYGREATRLALDFIRTLPCGEAKYCWLSYDIENEGARHLYRSFGFEEIPDAYREGGEMPAYIKL